jgi:phosphopantothenoylcysteine decarboxylase/phosphopantothenate--cysteine ligase
MQRSKFRCLITAGPTREFIDPVRFISNPSSGKMGYALAQAAIDKGWDVELISGPVALKAPEGVRLTKVVSGEEMYEACKAAFPNCDLWVMCAAVVDMRPKKVFEQKQKKDKIDWNLEFEPVVDILKTLAPTKTRQCVVGFAAETDHVTEYARDKLCMKQLDWIVANDVTQSNAGFESDNNTVRMFSRKGETAQFGPKPKTSIAFDILDTVTKDIKD